MTYEVLESVQNSVLYTQIKLNTGVISTETADLQIEKHLKHLESDRKSYELMKAYHEAWMKYHVAFDALDDIDDDNEYEIELKKVIELERDRVLADQALEFYKLELQSFES